MFDIFHESPVKTPTLSKLSISTPSAPMKQKKSFNKTDLKPKKLIYGDQTDLSIEQDQIQAPISGAENLTKIGKPRKASKENLDENKENDSTFAKLHNKGTMRLRNGKNVDPDAVPLRKSNAKRVLNKVSKKAPTDKKRCDKKDSNLQSAEIENETSLSQNIELIESLRRTPINFWVQCDDCKKWREVQIHKDPQKYHHTKWVCSMNTDEHFASCQIPEQSFENCEPTVESEYTPGNLVWAKFPGLPWWPGLIEESPETMSYYKVMSNHVVPHKYHVTFLEEGNYTYDWLSPKNIKPFHGKHEEVPQRMTKFQKLRYTKSVNEAIEFYKAAIPLSLDERLAHYSYTGWYRKKYCNENSNIRIPRVISNVNVNTRVRIVESSMEEVKKLVCKDTGRNSCTVYLDKKTYPLWEKFKYTGYKPPPKEDDEVEVVYMDVKKKLHTSAESFKYWMNVALNDRI